MTMSFRAFLMGHGFDQDTHLDDDTESEMFTEYVMWRIKDQEERIITLEKHAGLPPWDKPAFRKKP